MYNWKGKRSRRRMVKKESEAREEEGYREGGGGGRTLTQFILVCSKKADGILEILFQFYLCI
jgi:hypothetical protein